MFGSGWATVYNNFVRWWMRGQLAVGLVDKFWTFGGCGGGKMCGKFVVRCNGP